MGAVMKMDGSPLDQRPLPHDIDAEQQLLGALLMNNDIFGKVAPLVDAADFYEPMHQGLYESISEVVAAGNLASPITLRPLVSEIAFPDGTTGAQYLAHLCAEAAGPSQAVDYAKFIRDRADLRRIVTLARDVEARAMAGHPTDSAAAIIGDAETGFSDIRPANAGTSGFVSFEKSAQKAIENASMAYKRGAVLPGLSTGLTALDDVLGGLQRTDFIVIAGRPGMGKSAIAINIAYAVARDLQAKRKAGEKTGVVGVISLEMSDDQVAGRVLSERSRVSTHRIRRGRVGEREIEQYALAADELRSLPIETDSTPGLSIAKISLRARQLAKRKGLELLIVDYIQMIEGGGRQENRVQELTKITAGLKGLAKELGVPVVGLAQVGRQVEARDDKRPKISDLKESGSIEQDADVVMLLYRHEYYLKDMAPPANSTRYAEWEHDFERSKGRAEINIAKNRHGPTETVHVGYDSNVTLFKDELPDDIPPLTAERRDPQEKRRFKEGSLDAFRVLRALALSASVENDGHVDARKGTRLVPYRLWKAKCAEQNLDPDRSEASITTKMEGWFNDLKGKDGNWPPLVKRARSGDEIYVWLTDEAPQ